LISELEFDAKSMSFSDCGKHLVVNLDTGRPRIINLQDFEIYMASQALVQEQAWSQCSSEKQDLLPVTAMRAQDKEQSLSTILHPGSGKLIRSTHTTVVETSRGMQTISVRQQRDPGNISIQRQDANGDSVETLSLSVLPQKLGGEDSRVTIQLPRSRDDPMEIVLNKPPERWCQFSSPTKSNLPMVLLRDPSAIRVPNSLEQGIVQNKPFRAGLAFEVDAGWENPHQDISRDPDSYQPEDRKIMPSDPLNFRTQNFRNFRAVSFTVGKKRSDSGVEDEKATEQIKRLRRDT
jgi:hypothetical protein